ncbi:MAG: phosphomannomutase / phosphoglucomutase [Candidatus Atribacteria bacterium]|nr:phosphomannomutase / phosphoglucomutase [Candidatus Atribacteria bacterium]
MSIFKDCDIRGIFPGEINEEKAYLIGRAFASSLPLASTVVVGGDVRESTPLLREALIKGLLESEAKVVDLGIVPTPLFYFAVDKLKGEGGIMVTASHNPPEYNGFKITWGNLPPTPQDISNLAKKVEEKKFRAGQGGSRFFQNLDKEYLDFISSLTPPPSRSLRVAVDCGSGCYSDLAPLFLRNLGYEVIPLFCKKDGAFPYRSPNPSQKGNLKVLSQKVREEKANLGIAFDGDGDRVVFVDDEGKVLAGEEGMIFFLRNLLPCLSPGEKFIYDFKCSQIVPQEVKRLGGIPIPERSGHAYIKNRLLQENAFMAGEISGHYFFRELKRDDGLYATALFLHHLSQKSAPLSQIIKTFPQPHVTPDIRITTRGRENLLSILERSLSEGRISRLDGIKVEWEEGWAMIRKSVTEPAYTLRFEGKTYQDIPRLVHRFLQSLPEVEKEVLYQIDQERN